ncbi:MAG TPA: universal stress protein [Planctomycetota bacterium]|nr:universal stress protein [Planctomycetota bacterium]
MVLPVVRRILAPVELAETREPDLGYAIALAAQMRAQLLLLAVIDTPATVNLIGRHRAMAGESGDFDKALQDEVQHMLQQLVDKAAEAGVHALGHLTVSEDVEEEILKEALVRKVDLIVVRSRGRSGFMKALLGSTAGEILKAAPCPVLVART